MHGVVVSVGGKRARKEEKRVARGNKAPRGGRRGSGVTKAPSYEDVVHAMRVRLAGAPQLQNQPTRDIGHDLMANGYLPTEPDPALVRLALLEIKDEGGTT